MVTLYYFPKLNKFKTCRGISVAVPMHHDESPVFVLVGYVVETTAVLLKSDAMGF